MLVNCKSKTIRILKIKDLVFIQRSIQQQALFLLTRYNDAILHPDKHESFP